MMELQEDIRGRHFREIEYISK